MTTTTAGVRDVTVVAQQATADVGRDEQAEGQLEGGVGVPRLQGLCGQVDIGQIHTTHRRDADVLTHHPHRGPQRARFADLTQGVERLRRGGAPRDAA